MSCKKYFVSLIILTLYTSVYAQKVEIGGGGGLTFYKGDLQPRFNPLNPSGAGTAFLRYNFNKVLSVKTNVMYGQVRGDDDRSGDPFLKERGFAFKNTILDYHLQFEYNFLNFRTHTGRYEFDWTPYLFGGIGRSHSLVKKRYFEGKSKKVTTESGANEIVPFGIGIKKILGPRLNLTAEFSTRIFLNKKNAALFDGLSGIDGNNNYTFELSKNHPNYYYYYPGNTQQKDKYYHLSVTLSYLIYRVDCNDNTKKKFYFF